MFELCIKGYDYRYIAALLDKEGIAWQTAMEHVAHWQADVEPSVSRCHHMESAYDAITVRLGRRRKACTEAESGMALK